MITTDKHTLPKDKALYLTAKFFEAICGDCELDFLKAQMCTHKFVAEVYEQSPKYWVQVSSCINLIEYDFFKEYVEFENLVSCK